jgi:hypothetical protein
MTTTPAGCVQHIWRGAIRLAETKNGERLVRINKVTAAMQLFATFIMIPVVVIMNYVDTRPHATHAGPELIAFLCFIWLLQVVAFIRKGRKKESA